MLERWQAIVGLFAIVAITASSFGLIAIVLYITGGLDDEA